MENTWTTRDLPVLQAIVEFLDEKIGFETPELSDISERTGIAVDDVGRAAQALKSDGLIELRTSVGECGSWDVLGVSGDARRLVGQWPTAEQFVDAVAQQLQQAADAETDQEARSGLRELANSARGAARDVFVDVTAALISRQMGA
ncbi:hypothetical protein [Streptomyces sp. NPDC051016]|uniref:hypothetical protein n=1 Tax=Streptomyces sp. NPDC051016 TaxID=3365638 RepID=UPI0037AE8712